MWLVKRYRKLSFIAFSYVEYYRKYICTIHNIHAHLSLAIASLAIACLPVTSLFQGKCNTVHILALLSEETAPL